MFQLGRQAGSPGQRIDRQGRRVDRLPLLHCFQSARLVGLVAGVVLCSRSEAFAHISTYSPYRGGVSEANWAAVSNAIFFVGQLLGWVYLTAVLQAEHRRPLWNNVGLAFLFQAALAVVLWVAGVFSFFLVSLQFTKELHIVAAGFEIFGAVRPELVPGHLLASAVTFALLWVLSSLLLLIVRGMRGRRLTALFHVLVFHPFAFPAGILLGLMHVLYVWQIAPGKRAG